MTRRSRGGGQSETDYIEMVGDAAKEIRAEYLVNEVEMPMELVVESDSEVSMGICARLGVSKIHTRDMKYLWLQTKALDPQRHRELMPRVPATLVSARGTTGPAAPASSSSSTQRSASSAVYVDDVAFIGYRL